MTSPQTQAPPSSDRSRARDALRGASQTSVNLSLCAPICGSPRSSLAGSCRKRIGEPRLRRPSSSRTPVPRAARFTLHDLRRTCRTGLARLKVEPHIAERVLNHAQPGIAAVYDRHAYLKKQRAALEKWTDYLRRLRRGTEVDRRSRPIGKGRGSHYLPRHGPRSVQCWRDNRIVPPEGYVTRASRPMPCA